MKHPQRFTVSPNYWANVQLFFSMRLWFSGSQTLSPSFLSKKALNTLYLTCSALICRYSHQVNIAVRWPFFSSGGKTDLKRELILTFVIGSWHLINCWIPAQLENRPFSQIHQPYHLCNPITFLCKTNLLHFWHEWVEWEWANQWIHKWKWHKNNAHYSQILFFFVKR